MTFQFELRGCHEQKFILSDNDHSIETKDFLDCVVLCTLGIGLKRIPKVDQRFVHCEEGLLFFWARRALSERQRHNILGAKIKKQQPAVWSKAERFN